MNFLACNGTWLATSNGISCSGELVSITGQELTTQINGSAGATSEDFEPLYDIAVQLFVSVFVFLCLKRLLK